MALLYGEGREMAFARLERKVRRLENQIFASQPLGPRYFEVDKDAKAKSNDIISVFSSNDLRPLQGLKIAGNLEGMANELVEFQSKYRDMKTAHMPQLVETDERTRSQLRTNSGEKRVDVTIANNTGWTPLNAASDSGHLDVVKFLLENGGDVAIANNR